MSNRRIITMPTTAGKVKMPADNRVSTSASLRTSEIWQKSVKYDPYAPVNTEKANKEENLDQRAKNLFTLARLAGNTSTVTPGSCKVCGFSMRIKFNFSWTLVY